MEQDLFRFVTDTTKENYLESREVVVRERSYDPYSDDLNILEQMLGDGMFEDVIAFNTLNTALSPRAHLMKRIALIEMEQADDADLQLLIAQKILECIDMTGDGSMEKPFIVTRISDEQDYLSYTGDEFEKQALLQPAGKFVDVITTTTGKELHFDITDCYNRMQVLHDQRTAAMQPLPTAPEDDVTEDEHIPAGKKWWKFW